MFDAAERTFRFKTCASCSRPTPRMVIAALRSAAHCQRQRTSVHLALATVDSHRTGANLAFFPHFFLNFPVKDVPKPCVRVLRRIAEFAFDLVLVLPGALCRTTSPAATFDRHANRAQNTLLSTGFPGLAFCGSCEQVVAAAPLRDLARGLTVELQICEQGRPVCII